MSSQTTVAEIAAGPGADKPFLEPPVGLITWRPIPGKGRGVVAVKNCKAGTEIERSPVIHVPKRDIVQRDEPRTVHSQYLLYWSDEPDREVVLGCGLLPLYNHSAQPNVRLTQNSHEDTMSVIALRDIKAGEELTFDYEIELWFDPIAEEATL